MTQGRTVDQLPKSVKAVADFLEEEGQKELKRLNLEDQHLPDREETERLSRQILERALAAGELHARL